MFADLGGVPPPPLNERKPLVAKLMTEQGCSPKMQDQAKERHHCLNQQFWISIRKISIFSVLSITIQERTLPWLDRFGPNSVLGALPLTMIEYRAGGNFNVNQCQLKWGMVGERGKIAKAGEKLQNLQIQTIFFALNFFVLTTFFLLQLFFLLATIFAEIILSDDIDSASIVAPETREDKAPRVWINI